GGAITAVLQPENRGQGAAMNAGFKAARGEVIFFLDADDHLYPQAVSKVIAAWAPWVALVQFRLDLVDPEGVAFDVYPAPEVSFDSGNVVRLLLTTGRFEAAVTSGNAFSRRTLEAILPIPEKDFRMSADGYLVTVAPLVGSVVSIDEPLGAYCQHGNNSWAGIRASGEKFRKLLAHDAQRYRALTQKAFDLGLEVAPDLGSRDHRHVANQVASLTLDPDQHPAPADSRLKLAWRGVKASRRARLPLARRALLGGWFAASGVLPRALARPLVSWYLDKVSRPRIVQKMLHALRRVSR
ncbi:MAG: glycosyl transferase, partial [Myxococcaceae bacterium]|nr:glycosyl transferase [Myxococcaceae bacterium]